MNRFIVLLALLFTVSNLSFAGDFPIDKGSKTYGGTASVSYNTGFQLYLNPKFGYFVTKGLMVGTVIGLMYNSVDSFATNFGFKTAYYFGKKESRSFPYLGISCYKNTNRIIDGIISVPAIGLDIMSSEKIALNIEMGYRIFKYKDNTRDYYGNSDSFYLSFGFELFSF